MSDPSADTPGVVVFPPLLVATTLGAGLLFNWLLPWQVLPALPARLVGGLLVIAGGVVLAWGAITMRRAGTHIDPRQPSLTLVTDGPFRFSRNPLYLANIGIYLGIALLFNALWPLPLLVPLLLVLRWGVIQREERYLGAKFGEPYRAYCTRVRRWL